MGWSILLVTQFVLAAGLLLVAGAVLFLRPQSPAHRALSLFLSTSGLGTILNRAHEVSTDPLVLLVADRTNGYVQILIAASLAYFLVVYGRPTGTWRVRVGRILIATAAALAVAAAAVFPCLTTCRAIDAPDGILGNLAFYSTLFMATLGALRFARRADERAPGPQANWLMGLGFLLLWGTFGAFLLGLLAAGVLTFDASSILNFAIVAIGAVPALFAVQSLRHAPVDVTKPAWTFVATASVLVAFAAGAVLRFGASVGVLLFLLGLARFGIPVLVAYAVVKHRLLDSELHVRLVIRRGVVASAFAATFFILSESLEQVLPTSTAFAGIGAAVVIAVALRPLHALAAKLAIGLEAPEHFGTDERGDLYRDQVALVWQDGQLGTRDRRVLDHLADRLGLSSMEARRIEAGIRPDANI